MIGRRHHTIFDARDPRTCAEFWSAVLGDPVTYDDGEFVVVAYDTETSGLAFQRSLDHVAPTWPDPAVPQQVHLDVMVEDPVAAGVEVVALGAVRLQEDVYADPAGHPFCLIRRPRWAPPIDVATRRRPSAITRTEVIDPLEEQRGPWPEPGH